MPVIQPLSVSTIDGTSLLAASGNVAGAYAGPWRIDSQELTINYIRHPFREDPYGGFSVPDLSTSPHQSDATGFGINNTQVLYSVTVRTRTYKDYATYDTSTYTQPQRFSVQGSPTDYNDPSINYGQLTDGSAMDGSIGASQFSMGAWGSIVTNQIGYTRRAWVDTDVEADEVRTFYCNGWQNLISNSFIGQIPQCIDLTNPDTHFNDFNWGYGIYEYTYTQPFDRASSQFATDPILKRRGAPNYHIPGSFNCEKEADYYVRDFVNDVANKISAASIIDRTLPLGTTTQTLTPFYEFKPILMEKHPSYGPNQWTADNPQALQAPMTKYNPLWHDWS